MHGTKQWRRFNESFVIKDTGRGRIQPHGSEYGTLVLLMLVCDARFNGITLTYSDELLK